MIKEATCVCVQCGNSSHVFLVKFKVKNIEILFHPFIANRFWDCNNTALSQPAQNDLCHGF